MRKVKSTALLGAFVAVASVGVISHEAHGTTIASVSRNVAKEILTGSVTLPAPILTPSAGYTGANITLTLSGANFTNNSSYTIVGIVGGSLSACSASGYGTSSVTFDGCGLTGGNSYTITGGAAGISSSSVAFTVPQSSNSIVLSYSSNVTNDEPASSTLAQVMPQLAISVSSSTTAVINPSSLTAFTNASPLNVASNSVLISNSAYGNNSTWASNTISGNYTINFLFTGIPSSVSLVSATDGVNASQSATPGNGSATIAFSLSNGTASGNAPFYTSSSDSITFAFSNTGNIQPGTISLSSITGVTTSPVVNYVYSSTPQNFLTFTLGGTQLYIPDALAPDNNVIQSGYITISMPSTASIASISVLNNPSASCPTNGILTSTTTPNVFYINLRTLASLCTGLTPDAWQSGVPLVIYISGSNATPTNITADAYAVFENMLKRIPVDVLNASSSSANFSY
jgi:hypothetical protein